MNNYQEYISRKQREHGEKFDPSELAQKFTPYFNSGQRIEIAYRGPDGEKFQGYVGVTTGWRPCFILVHNKRSLGSGITLADSDIIIRTFNTYRR